MYVSIAEESLVGVTILPDAVRQKKMAVLELKL